MTLNRRMGLAAIAVLLSLPVQAAELGTGEWYLRLTAISGDLKDSGNVLGQLKDSKKGYDLHDLEELSPFATPYLTIVFPHPDWGEHAGDYGSDFHNTRGRLNKWTFEVRSDDPNRDVTLSWSSQTDMSNMILIDSTTRTRVAALNDGQVQDYQFNMGGQTTRTFKWVARNAKPTQKKRDKR